MQTLKKLFPFYIRIDKKLNIVEYGLSMGKFLVQKGRFEDHFKFIRPNFGITYTFKSIVEFMNQVFILELHNHPKKIRFKGQFIIHHENEDELWFCGSPWLMSVEDLQQHNLFVTDFAQHDSAIDTILMLNQNLLNLQDNSKMISDLKQKNERLQQVNERLDAIIYAITHDFRAPLLASIGLLQLPESMVLEELPEILHTLKRLDRTIIHLNELSKNEKVALKFTPINWEELIHESHHNYTVIYDTKIPIHLSINETTPFHSDNFRIRTIVNNLISNAIKYARPTLGDTHFIKISIHTDPSSCIFIIEDNGEGIDKKNLENIFKLFYRASIKSQGNGIGLYIIKEMVHYLKGTITVKSIKNEGTTFTLKFPNQKTE
ncbi:ATP-binding protein [Flavobacterium sp.]|jgi:signal transduction histidine kinase|uniref:ATP-binding protein n=1 Tax=Flavobacterium sp. TaxID=239 RepID=UPI00333EC5FB